MPMTRSAKFSDMTGINLFHAARSNCSARVRLLLSEKAIAWNSWLISLRDHENRRPEYFAINPKGLVPTLIHEGWVITESNDILQYVEDRFPETAFRPGTAGGRMAMSHWMGLSAELHLPGVKTFNYSRGRLATVRRSPDEMDRYRMLQRDPELLCFHEKAGRNGFSARERASAEYLLTSALREMDDVLMRQSWLAGDTYSLADICWAPTIPTVVRGGLDLGPFSRVRAWHQKIAERNAYCEAVIRWEEAP